MPVMLPVTPTDAASSYEATKPESHGACPFRPKVHFARLVFGSAETLGKPPGASLAGHPDLISGRPFVKISYLMSTAAEE